MGGSGLIVVVIVAAWALFLVPQWLHRRASAAAHLADRVPAVAGDDESAAGDSSSTARRFGRRQLARSRPHSPRRSRWPLHVPRRLARPRSPERSPASSDPAGTGLARPDVPSKETAVHPSGPRSAAARRRRVVVGLASLTILAALVVAGAAVASVPVPAWVVAVPGGLLVAYLALLAMLRPGARAGTGHDGLVEVEPLSSVDGDEAYERSAWRAGARVRAEDEPVAGRAAQRVLPAAPSAASDDASTGKDGSPSTRMGGDGSPSTWTPVPLPTPTYVTAPRARRSVRTIDLSNPGSWTASPVAGAAGDEADSSAGFLRSTPSKAASSPAAQTAASSPAGHDDADGDDARDEYLERRRAVGD